MNPRITFWVYWIVGIQAFGFLLGRLGSPASDVWYSALRKSPFTPSGRVFSLVWPLLYLLLAFVGGYLWTEYEGNNKYYCLSIYALQLILNWCWMPVFFIFHAVGGSLMLVGAMVVLTGNLIWVLKQRVPYVALALAPYLAWISFAFYLNAHIWVYN